MWDHAVYGIEPATQYRRRRSIIIPSIEARIQIYLSRRDGSSGVFRIWQRGAWRARGARAYNGSLGAEPPAESRGRAPGRGVREAKLPEAEALFAFKSSMEAANSPIFF